MPTKKKKDIRRELLDELLAGYSKPEDLTGPDGLLKQLSTIAVVARTSTCAPMSAQGTLYRRSSNSTW